MKVHKCPGCGYIVSDIEFRMARYNFRCPRCGDRKLSEFSIEEIKTDGPTGNEQAA